MLNKAIIGGRLTKSPETTATTSGKEVTRFSVAIPRKYNREETDFLNVVAFGKTAEFVSKYFDKGSSIIVVGSIQTRSWEHEGQKRYATEIVADEVNFAGSKKDEENKPPRNAPTDNTDDSDPLEELGFTTLQNDDNLPF
jgi:single-strand DNA-binding protein